MAKKQSTADLYTDYVTLWNNFVHKRAQELGPHTTQRWLSSLEPLPAKGKGLRLQAKDAFQVHWFEEHIRPMLLREFLDASGLPIPVQIILNARRTRTKKSAVQPVATQLQWSDPDPLQTLASFNCHPDDEATFEFISQVATQKIAAFNPIYIYGPKQSGKTHLLNALALAFQTQHRTIFTTGEQFAEHVVSAMRRFDMQRFRQAYRNIDCLILDNIEGLSHKTASQEEFFHTFNTLHMASKPIIISAHTPPEELEGMEQRLVSRFEWGIALQVTPQRSRLQNAAKEITPQRIVDQVAAHYRIHPKEILGKGQRRLFSQPRQVAMFLCRELLGMSYKKIGRFFDRDHSTVITSIQQTALRHHELRSHLLNLTEKLIASS